MQPCFDKERSAKTRDLRLVASAIFLEERVLALVGENNVESWKNFHLFSSTSRDSHFDQPHTRHSDDFFIALMQDLCE